MKAIKTLKTIFISPFGYLLVFAAGIASLIYGLGPASHLNKKSRYVGIGVIRSTLSIATFLGPDKTQITTSQSVITIKGTPILKIGDSVYVEQERGYGYLKTSSGETYDLSPN